MAKRRRRKYERVILAADGGTLTTCAGCGLSPWSSKRLRPCPRCGTLVCRTCAEDQPHRLSASRTCELPPGVEPRVWGLPVEGRVNAFAKDDAGEFLCLKT
jgi:hypothetical protein